MTTKMGAVIDRNPDIGVRSMVESLVDLTLRTVSAQRVGDGAVHASRLRSEARSNVDRHILEGSVSHTSLCALTTAAEAIHRIEYWCSGELLGVSGLVPVTGFKLSVTLGCQERTQW